MLGNRNSENCKKKVTLLGVVNAKKKKKCKDIKIYLQFSWIQKIFVVTNKKIKTYLALKFLKKSVLTEVITIVRVILFFVYFK